MKKLTLYSLLITLYISLFNGCASKQPLKSSSATILIKTPHMKFYDRGFITKYDTFTKVQIFNAGTAVLTLSIYDDRICKDNLFCMDPDEFNKNYLHKSYSRDFLKKLFEKEDKEIRFKDSKNSILIKIIR